MQTKQIYFKAIKIRTVTLFFHQNTYLHAWKLSGILHILVETIWDYSPDWTWCLCSGKTLTHCFLNTVHTNYLYHYKPFTRRSISSPLVTQFVTFQNVWRNNLIFQYNYKVCSYPTKNSGFFGGAFVCSDTKAPMSFCTLDVLFSDKEMNELMNKEEKSCLLQWSFQ